MRRFFMGPHPEVAVKRPSKGEDLHSAKVPSRGGG
jgi:hypothetical protein